MNGLAFLGSALSPPKGGWVRLLEEQARVTLCGVDTDRALVVAALRLLDDRPPSGALTVALFGYESAVALDARAPRRAHDHTLGPDVVVWRARPVDAPAPGLAGNSGPCQLPTLSLEPDARRQHLARVRAARELIFDGVVYQANLAHRLLVPQTARAPALSCFCEAVSSAAPSCAAWLDVGGWGSVVSLSPERFVTIDEAARTARAFPIKGTRPRGASPAEDRALRAQLCASWKDAAEHVMIVDLLRNDLGRVARPGGVSVERLLDVVSVANVHHLESTIAAHLREDVRHSDVMLAALPGGSITGAPKSSAVESIAALEDGPRGLYTGVLVVVDEHGTLRSSLLIRTWLRPDDGEGSLHVGGGIVADSVPEEEWQETLVKARAFGEVSDC